jgi:hypothetical protein
MHVIRWPWFARALSCVGLRNAAHHVHVVMVNLPELLQMPSCKGSGAQGAIYLERVFAQNKSLEKLKMAETRLGYSVRRMLLII